MRNMLMFFVAAQVEALRDACMCCMIDGFDRGFCLRLKLGARMLHEGCMREYRGRERWGDGVLGR